MTNAYYNCQNLTGSPVCGNNVTAMTNAYYYCTNLTGSPVCGEKVTSMVNTYRNCVNLTGTPVFGNNVVYLNNAYRNCANLSSGTINLYSNNVSYMTSCFYGKNKSRRYNIRAYQNTNTWNTLYKNNTQSIVGANITWTNYTNGGFYNTTYNIYVLPIT